MMDFASFARAHGVLIGTLLDDGRVHRVPTVTKPRKRNGAYRFTGDWGWVQSWDSMVEPAVWKPERRDAPIAAPVRRIPVDETQVQAAACERARGVVARCRFESHAYLTAKGFPQAKGLVDPDGRLVVPMWDVQTYKRIQSVQWIDANGGKKFMPGGAAKGGVYRLGAGSDWWLCEGYATGLSLAAALKALYWPAAVLVCFSAGNLIHVSTQIRGRLFVMADNDASQTGQNAAESTGARWVMPDEIGSDANDVHATRGLRALCELVGGARST